MSGVFVTGATGTVGSAVVTHLLGRGERVIAGVRTSGDAARSPAGMEARPFAEFVRDHAAVWQPDLVTREPQPALGW